ncbi:hypothetical protein [Streptomyces sp. NPDC049744]|uniref:hypothetical protein n=1 Tax=Streptomyces sp. NPDC049744 TaxID=3154359 RepID=UPI0034152979
MAFRADDPCDGIKGPAKRYCERGEGGEPLDDDALPDFGEGAIGTVQDLADSLIKKLQGLLAPDSTWAPEKSDSWIYQQFLWLGQHLAVAIFICVVVVCALTAWQGAPRLKQMGASTGWTLAAVAGMASVPGVVMLLNRAVSGAFAAAFNSNESTLFGAISKDMDKAADTESPLAVLLILAALVVSLAFAALVFMSRNLGILVFVCMAPVVLASLARGGDTSAVKAWMQRLLGLMFAPMALLLLSPFVPLVEGTLVMDTVLLVAADALMLRMIFHGVPYFGPKLAGAARAAVERRTESPLARAFMRAGSPNVYEQENTERRRRTVDTPRRAMTQDRGVLFAAYGFKQPARPGRLTTESVIERTRQDRARTERIREARKSVRQSASPASGGPGVPASRPSPTRAPAPPGTPPSSTP